MDETNFNRRDVLKSVSAGIAFSGMTGTALGEKRNNEDILSSDILFGTVSYLIEPLDDIPDGYVSTKTDHFPSHVISNDDLYLNMRYMPQELINKFKTERGIIWDGQYHKTPTRITNIRAYNVASESSYGNPTLARGISIPNHSLVVKNNSIKVSGIGQKPKVVEENQKKEIKLEAKKARIQTHQGKNNVKLGSRVLVQINNHGLLSVQNLLSRRKR